LRCARDTLPALRREDSSILKGFVHSGKRTGPGTDREIGPSDHRAIGKNKTLPLMNADCTDHRSRHREMGSSGISGESPRSPPFAVGSANCQLLVANCCVRCSTSR